MTQKFNDHNVSSIPVEIELGPKMQPKNKENRILQTTERPMFNFNDKNDTRIREDVRDELSWDPRLPSSEISIDAQDGFVTLGGKVPHSIEKTLAEKAAQRVGGVKGVADEIEVNLSHQKL